MSYCRFENTHNDLQDCTHALSDEGLGDLSTTERYHAEQMYELCKTYIEEFDMKVEQEEQEQEEEDLTDKI